MRSFPESFDHDTLPPPSCNRQLESSLPCDAWHHFYHYQSSAQYLWLAQAFAAQGRADEAAAALERSLFQDHFNREALARKAGTSGEPPRYANHPDTDIAFCASVGELPGEATAFHDEAVHRWRAADYAAALTLLARAIAAEPLHSNSYFLRGKCYFSVGDFAAASAELKEAVRLSHLKHDAYHRFASLEHLARGKRFLETGGIDVAINDFTKALDLYRGNEEALRARASAYRAKGNEALAREDESALLNP